jgi:pseudomonalisin
MERILLQLSSSPEQEAALEQLLADQQDPKSPRYHAWLSPEQFGEQFGAMRADVDTVTSWLASQGLQVTEVAAGRRTIELTGTVQQVESAFHATIHRYQWNGREHIANAADISIPAALTRVVKGVASLNDFGVRPFHHFVSTPMAPQANFSGGVRGLSPYDFAAIYNVSPLWTSGYDGTGQSIAIPGQTDIKVSDVTSFRATFGLPANNPTIIVNGTDPGTVSGDETESDLDVEWAGAVAKGATIKFVTSASTNSSDGVTLSAQYIVQHATAPVMSISYGMCEAQMGSENAFYSSLWQQAAAEGIAVFVAAGDSGSAGCDAPNGTAPASEGFGVNGLASTAYNVAVGGTQFNDTASPSTYWNASNSSQLASAKGYIPEAVWNESSVTGTKNLYAGGGGASINWPRPGWQAGTGVPTGSTRLTPDVSLTAAGHDGYVIEQEGSLYLVGGTSASTPSFAGLMAIVNQYTHSTNGNPNSKLYAMASSVPAIFHDVTTGSNAVPCQGGSANCSATAPSTNVGQMNGYSAGAGYDMATGLGSVDANALVLNWSGVVVAPSIVSLTPNPMFGSAASQSLTVNGAGFVAGSTVKVGSVTYQGAAVTFVSSSQLTVMVNVGAGAQSVSVQVIIPGGQTTNAAALTVTAPVAPAIATLTPNPMSGSNSVQTLTINGASFVSGSGLIVTLGGTAYQGSLVTFVSSSQVTASVVVGVGAMNLAVQVTNPGGLASNLLSLAVIAPSAAPVISALNPNPMAGSSSAQTLTISGSGFVSGSGLKVTVGVNVYQGSQVTYVSSAQLTASVLVGIGTVSLPVQVTNPGGKAGNTLNLIVNAPSTAPIITTLSPNPMTASNSPQTLTINGSGFQPGLKLLIGSALIAASQLATLTSTQLQVNVVTGLTAYTYAVQVINDGGHVSNVLNLQVNAPPLPAITSLTPVPLTHSSAAQTLTVNGANFQAGAGLRVTVGNTAYSGSQVAFVSTSQLKVTLIVASASSAALAVTVIDPSGAVSNAASLTVK